MRMLFIFLLLSPFAYADEILRPQSHSDHPEGLRFEYARKIKGIKVAWANYEALRRDFPEIQSLTNEEINKWLETNLSYIGSQQSRLNNIRHTPIPLDGSEVKEAFRPESWHRSAQLQVRDPQNKKDIGLVDIKGFGFGDHSVNNVDKQLELYREAYGNADKINKLRIRDHSDGLMSFGEAIAETTRQIAIQKLFEVRGLPFETVETYAIFRLPFNILKENSQEIPAGFYIRQAHVGRSDRLPVPDEIYVDEFGYKQMTDQGTAVDFGGAIVTDPLLKDNYGAPLTANPQSTKPWVWGHEVALAFDRGDTEAVFRHLREMLSPIHNLHQISQNVKIHTKKDKVLRRYVQYLRNSGLSFEEMKQKLKKVQSADQPRKKGTKVKDQTSLQNLKTSLKSSDVGEVNDAIKSLIRFDFKNIEPLINDPRLLNKFPHTVTLIELLAEIPDNATLPLLQKIYRSGNPMIKSMVLGALKNKNGTLVSELIKISLTSPYFKVKEAAIAALEGLPEEKALPLAKKYIQAQPLSQRAVIFLAKLKSEESLDILINDFYLKNNRAEDVLENLKYRNDEKSLNFLLTALRTSQYKRLILKTLALRSDLPTEQRKNFLKDTAIDPETRYLFYKFLAPIRCEKVFQN